jgi:hypothetical protein
MSSLQLLILPETKERKLQSVLHSNIRNTERSQSQATLGTLQGQQRKVLCSMMPNFCLPVLAVRVLNLLTICRFTMQSNLQGEAREVGGSVCYVTQLKLRVGM